MAEKWQGFQRTKDLYPNLRYSTVGDKRVRAKHKEWDGFVAPIDHPIWKKLLPPNDWGCRCTVVATDEDVSDNLNDFQPKIKKEFANNAGVSGAVFKTNSYESVLNDKQKNKSIEILKKTDRIINTRNPKVKIHLDADKQDLKRNYQVADICAKETNHKFLIREHIEQKKLTNPEYLIDDEFLADRKSITSNNGILNQIKKSKNQLLNKDVNPTQKPYYIVFDLDAVENLNWQEIERNISRAITPQRGTKIKGLFISYKNKAILLDRETIIKRDLNEMELLK